MLVQYIIDNDPTHRFEIDIDLDNQGMTAKYIQNETIFDEDYTALNIVMEYAPTEPANVEIKKELGEWIIRFFKVRPDTVVLEASVALVVNPDLNITNVLMNNDTLTDVYVYDYKTDPL